MGKIIAVCGGHGCGKTTAAANLGYILAQDNLAGILSTNMMCGIVQHLCNTAVDEQHGLYEITMSRYDSAKASVPCSSQKNLFLLSLADSHNCLTLADEETGMDGERAKEVLAELKGIFQYLIVDCEPEVNNPLSVYSIVCADLVINLIKPTVPGIAFHQSYQPLFTALKVSDEKIVHIANNDKNYVGIKNLERAAGIKIWLDIPYYKSVEEAENTGRLACTVKNEFSSDIGRLAGLVKERAADEQI